MDATEHGMHFIKMKKNFVIYAILVILCTLPIRAASIPTVGGNTDTWGDILNAYLLKEHNITGNHNVSNMSVSGLAIKEGRWLDVTAYGAVGDGITDDTNAIQAAINNAGINGGIVFLPVGDYLVSSSLIIYSGITLQGNGEGTKIIAASNLNDSVIKSSSDYLLNNTQIRDLEINASNQISGSGIWLRIGELTTIDMVKISNACNDGIVIYGNSSPVVLGYISLVGNGRCGSGSGVYINDSQYTSNYIEYLVGMDNKDALVKVRNFNKSSLFLTGFDVKKTEINKQNYVIWLENGEQGGIIIGGGSINQSNASQQGDAILYNTIGESSIGKFEVLGGISYNESYVNYSWYYASDDPNSSNQSFIDLNERPFSQMSHFFRAGYSPYALQLEDAAKFSSIKLVYPGYEIRFTNDNFENISSLGVGGTNSETVYWKYIKGSTETWMNMIDTLYNWFFPNDAIAFAPGGNTSMIIISSYYGRIGIGKTSLPVSTLEVNGTITLNTSYEAPIILARNTTAIACSGANVGRIIYSSHMHYGCNGTSWNALY